ncbi:MAG: TonB family protein, partial [Aureispira sp.]
FGLQSKNLNLVEIILGSLYYYFDFNSSFFQKKWTTACTSQPEVPKELRFLKFLEKSSKANWGELSMKHNNAIIYLAVFYKKNRFKAEFDSIKPLVDKIAPDTLSKIEINSDYFPRFPGCEIEGMSMEKRKLCADQKLLKFIYSNLKYPKIAFDKNITGTVIIKFTVTHKGKIKDAAIVRNIGGGCGEEVLRIINLMNSLPTPWVPGIIDDKLVSIKYELPIKFMLNR